MITLSELRTELRLNPREDHRLPAIRDQVIALWEGATGRLWNAREDHVQVFDRTECGTDELLLELWPVAAVVSVRERAIGESSWSMIDSSEYFLYGRRTLARTSGSWRKKIEVTYDGGYAEAPADVRRALSAQALFMMQRLSADRVAFKSTAVAGAGGASFEDGDLCPLFSSLARQYARKA